MGFQYNGISSQSMNIKARLTGWQMVPTFFEQHGNRSRQSGSCGLLGPTAASGTSMFPAMSIRRKPLPVWWQFLDRAAAWLDPMVGTKQLVLDDVPDRYFMARLSDTVDCERLLRSAGSFTLRFLCPDPYGYALDDETFTLSQAGEHEVEREIGNTDSEPVYSLQGTISSGAVVLTTNGETPASGWPAGCGGSAGDRHRNGHSQSDGQRGQYPAKRPALFGGAEFPSAAPGCE